MDRNIASSSSSSASASLAVMAMAMADSARFSSSSSSSSSMEDCVALSSSSSSCSESRVHTDENIVSSSSSSSSSSFGDENTSPLAAIANEEAFRSYIRLIQHLIERCLMLYMGKEECVDALANHAAIPPPITITVWKELKKQNPHFFLSYLDQRQEKFHGQTFETRQPRLIVPTMESTNMNSTLPTMTKRFSG